jgi:hypothetical protein
MVNNYLDGTRAAPEQAVARFFLPARNFPAVGGADVIVTCGGIYILN